MSIHAVVKPEHDAEGWTDPPGLGRHVLIGSIVGIFLSLPLITLGALAAGQKWQSALGLGLFTSLWGGMGFGSMVGGVIYATKIEAEH